MEENQNIEREKRKRKYMVIAGPLIILIVLVGVTYAFFNYTRIGTANTINTGRISFNTSQSDTLNITNYFPMSSTEAGDANLDVVTLAITGDTTYADGEEFEIKLVDVTNTINNKQIPINYIATYTANTGGTIGTSNNDYWENRNDKDSSIYLLNAEGEVEEGKQVLVGYIDNGAAGINGTLTIKAYVDADRIAISDTYPSKEGYNVNTNMSSIQLNYCIDYFGEIMDVEHYPLPTGHTLEAFCQGTGTLDFNLDSYITFQELLDNNDTIDYLYDDELQDLEENGVINYFSNETSSEWIAGRTVFTTTEWNSFSSTPLSFKIRAESNEGIWVKEPARLLTMDEMCPDCVFAFNTTILWTTWNTDSRTPTVLTSSDYEENYEDVIASSGMNFFLGLKLNESSQIERVYACGLYNETTPFCIEGYYDGSKYARNQEILQNEYLWNNTCQLYEEGTSSEYMSCASPSTGLISAGAFLSGAINVGAYGYCTVGSNGGFSCDYFG